jgi:hypothetical protein
MKTKIKQFLEFFRPVKCDHESLGSKKIMDEARRLRDQGSKKIIKLLQTFDISELYQCKKCGNWRGFKF